MKNSIEEGGKLTDLVPGDFRFDLGQLGWT